jgi:CheY-like chemotaxis protein
VAKRILIVEDNQDNRIVYAMFLEHCGYEIDEAVDAETALLIAREHAPDLILLDIGLPGMDGWELCNLLKADASTAQIKILVVTAHTFAEDRARAIECGADGYLAKPIEPSGVHQEVIKLIGAPV